jgi:flagellar hook-basal body complex protein FliE
MITGVSSIPQLALPSAGSIDPTAASLGTAGSPSFSSVLGQAFQQVNQLQNSAASQAESFALGRSNDIHSTVIAAQKATVALELATQIRNKVLDAYQEVMKTSM